MKERNETEESLPKDTKEATIESEEAKNVPEMKDARADRAEAAGLPVSEIPRGPAVRSTVGGSKEDAFLRGLRG